ncbi:MAG: sulfite exporter TauE/SafE family protein [Deltaproteobacteria bacterium]|nr:sulfite exporter TauE/SafE family protein [Deltaproteobacteria bacterium]
MDVLETLMLVSGGLAAGTLGGMLGIGGGIALMPLLRFVVGLSPAVAAGTCAAAVFFTTLGGSYRHYRLGHLDIRSVVPIIIAGATTTGVFSLFFLTLARRGHWLDLGIGLVFCLISLRMIAEGTRRAGRDRGAETGGSEVTGSLPHKIGIGAAAGVLPGLLGIGTGGVLVPAFTFLLKTPIRTAMAASLLCFCFNALISSAFKLAQGFMDVGVALPICLGTLLGANLGAVLNRRFSLRKLKLLFGLVFGLISLRFICSFIEGTT